MPLAELLVKVTLDPLQMLVEPDVLIVGIAGADYVVTAIAFDCDDQQVPVVAYKV